MPRKSYRLIEEFWLEIVEGEEGEDPYYQTHLVSGDEVFTLRHFRLPARKVAEGKGSANVRVASSLDAEAIKRESRALKKQKEKKKD